MTDALEYVLSWVLDRFLAERLKVGGSPHDPSILPAVKAFVKLDEITSGDVESIGKVFDPRVHQRRVAGQDMVFGGIEAPKGGDEIEARLAEIISIGDAYRQFMAFMRLHPLSDANGRVSRLIWFRNMLRARRFYEIEQTLVLGFLHAIYYQAIRDGAQVAKTPTGQTLSEGEKCD